MLKSNDSCAFCASCGHCPLSIHIPRGNFTAKEIHGLDAICIRELPLACHALEFGKEARLLGFGGEEGAGGAQADVDAGAGLQSQCLTDLHRNGDLPLATDRGGHAVVIKVKRNK